ncbi:MAG: sigma-70 family RNA polymerase sigma factor [Planctomycetaceae bacterium]|nr:MAG: sigma-70 family RNA polymerase sigma factor [Planctomycetaceae bacterium]
MITVSAPQSVYQQHAREDQCHELILEHLSYVRHVVGRIGVGLPAACDREDLESAGMVGLIEAARQFDPGRGVPFSAFALPRIRGAVFDELRRNMPVSQKKHKQIVQVQQAWNAATPPVSVEDIAEKTGFSTDVVWECLELIRLLHPEPWKDLESAVQACAARPRNEVAENVERNEALRVLADAIEQLPQRERLSLTLYHLEDLRLKEIAEVLDVSESRVSRIVARAEFRVKEFFRAKYAL